VKGAKMNKAVDKLHEMFLKGTINGAVFEYMFKMANSVDTDEYAPLIVEHANNIETLGIKTAEGCKEYFFVYTKCPRVIERLSGTVLSKKQLFKLCQMAFKDNKSTEGKLDKLALDFIKENNLIKTSYPNSMCIDGSGYVSPQYNIEKWIETLRTIYSAASLHGKPMASTLKELTANWPVKERINFERWMKFYQEGEHQKYNVKVASLTKNAQQYQYLPRAQLGQLDNILNPPAEEKEDKKDEVSKSVKKKLRGRLTSMDKILYEYGDVFPDQELRELVSIIKNLDDKIRFLHLKASITNCLIRSAGQLQKRGFVEGANELHKIAQEVATDTLPEPPQEVAAPAPAENAPAPVPNPELGKDGKPVSVPSLSASQDEIDMPDFNSATIKDALSKLEEVNKVISERNVVRALAAVDIILGQLGIASYFPKLSEAQSKLMDAFNYAGTRVAEVIGQMRGGQGAISAKPEPESDTVEVSEDLAQPVSEVVPGAPQAAEQQQLQAPVQETPEAPQAEPKSKEINVTR
jgi:hypothetical protein